MPNGHVAELQIHLRAIMNVKEGVGHKLYERIRTIEAAARTENRPLTKDEAKTVRALREEMRAAYDAACIRDLLTPESPQHRRALRVGISASLRDQVGHPVQA